MSEEFEVELEHFIESSAVEKHLKDRTKLSSTGSPNRVNNKQPAANPAIEWDSSGVTANSSFISTSDEVELELQAFLDESATRNVGQDPDGGNHRSRKRSSAARKKWKHAAKKAAKLAVVKSATGKVKLENKIGVKTKDLDDDDVMKIISLSLQRALRDFGRDSAASRKSSSGLGGSVGASQDSTASFDLEGKLASKDVLVFNATDINNCEAAAGAKGERSGANKKYSVRQPGFECGRIRESDFKRLRSAFGVSERQYYATMGLQEKRTESDFYVISSKDASGKSVSFFFLTTDQRFILKLCTRKDVETTAKVLNLYTKHVESCCPSGKDGRKLKSTTLLPRCLGLYYLRFEDKAIPPVVLMAQVNFFAAAYEIHKKFDLKGSLHGRFASEKERKKKSPVLKDLDWINEERRVRFSSKAEMDIVRAQLQKDTSFLSDLGLIDYSLLVGVHEMDEEKLPLYDVVHEPFGVPYTRSEKDLNIYYFGIVDVMTAYGRRKRAETFFTGTMMCCRDVSCQAPEVYRRRFMNFCDYQILAHEKDGTNDE